MGFPAFLASSMLPLFLREGGAGEAFGFADAVDVALLVFFLHAGQVDVLIGWRTDYEAGVVDLVQHSVFDGAPFLCVFGEDEVIGIVLEFGAS
jgi:hypothetical protein